MQDCRNSLVARKWEGLRNWREGDPEADHAAAAADSELEVLGNAQTSNGELNEHCNHTSHTKLYVSCTALIQMSTE